MTAQPANVVQPLRIADARQAVRHVFIHDLVLPCLIGIHRHEHGSKQPVRINLDLAVDEGSQPLGDEIGNVVCYETIATGVRGIIDRGHVNLVETLAEQIAAMCLTDARVRSVRVRIEKLNVIPDATSVGVEIERFKAPK